MLTPVDIENKVFKKSKFGGYDISDVEDFLETIIVDYEVLYKENAESRDKLLAMQESISYYKSLEEGIEQSVETAYSEADTIKETASKEADLIKREVELEAKERLNSLNLDIKAKEIELEEKKKIMQIYKIKISSMLKAQLKILEESEE